MRAKEHPDDVWPRMIRDQRGLNASLHFIAAASTPSSPPGRAPCSAARPSGASGVFKLMSVVLQNGQSPHPFKFTPHENSY